MTCLSSPKTFPFLPVNRVLICNIKFEINTLVDREVINWIVNRERARKLPSVFFENRVPGHISI